MASGVDEAGELTGCVDGIVGSVFVSPSLHARNACEALSMAWLCSKTSFSEYSRVVNDPSGNFSATAILIGPSTPPELVSMAC